MSLSSPAACGVMLHDGATHFFADDGQAIPVHVAGRGNALVMLHGWTADHDEWRLFVKELSRHHRLFLWDARGHGDWPLTTATGPTVQRMARDLAQLLAHFGLTQVTLVGHSMGALIAWEYLRQFGQSRIAHLCIIDQSPKLLTDAEWNLGIYGDFDADRAAGFLDALRQDFAESVLRLSAHGLNGRARASYADNTRGWQRERERLQKLTPAPLIATWQSLVQADYRDMLEKIAVPALLIYGEQSNFYSLQTAHYMQSKLPCAALHVYDGTDHSPHLWQPDRFMRDLLALTAGAGRA